MENKRIEELEKLLEENCDKYCNNCKTCPFNKECDEYSKIYQELEK